MAQALVRNLDDDVVADYKLAAKAKGRSLEAELRDVIVSNRPKIRLSPAERRALSDKLVAGGKIGTDSVTLIREAREERDAQFNVGR